MLRSFYFCFFVWIGISLSLFAENNIDSLGLELQNTMQNKDLYVAQKTKRIDSLKTVFSLDGLNLSKVYDINSKLIHEYKKYRSDSAIFYSLQNLDIAKDLNVPKLITETNLELAWLYSTTGLYIESQKILAKIDRSSLDNELLVNYFDVYVSFYSHYGQSNNSPEYYTRSELYRDSLLLCMDKESLKYRITFLSKLLYQGHKEEAQKLLQELLEQTDDTNPERAMIAYLLGYMYKNENNLELQREYFSISAIADLKNAIKDNASLQSLAIVFYELGNIDQAYLFIQSAVDDAVFCNVRYRTVEASSFYPIINAAYQLKEKQQKNELQKYLLLISLLVVFLIIVLIYVYKQMKKVAKIRKELSITNQTINDLNQDLVKLNEELMDTNIIKEEYIAHFFELCSSYIDKLENYRKLLNKKATSNQLEELFATLKSNTLIDNELEELYKNFDGIFLNLYPTFIADFNMLLDKDEQIIPKKGELLNTELRIFALIRLGTTDSVKIAHFLRYSLRTVYNYRTKVRNKASVSRDAFEEMVKKIGAPITSQG